jgi:hypothetical protein
MKYCSHEMHPPQTRVVRSSKDNSELASARRTIYFQAYQLTAGATKTIFAPWRLGEKLKKAGMTRNAIAKHIVAAFCMHKALSLHTESAEPLELPAGVELLTTESISVTKQ